MPTYEKLRGLVAIASNSPHVATGYGVQTKMLSERLVRHGVYTAVLSNYGQEGRIDDIKTSYGSIRHYPHGYNSATHGIDMIPTYYAQHRNGREDLPHALMTLYDVWVYNNLKFDGPILSWVPVDHLTLPKLVRQFLVRDNVHPIAMSPHGQRVLTERGIECDYVPHAVDMSVYKPSSSTAKSNLRKKLGIADDTFLAIMVAANKGNGSYHRKGLFENIAAFAMFHKANPNTHLYLHTDMRPVLGGLDLPAVLESLGLGTGQVSFADPDELMVGIPDKMMADIYSAADVLLAASYGEGFYVPLIEAQACGTPVITSSWTASQDLAGPTSYMVDGQIFWNQTQNAYLQIPSISSIYSALEQMFEKWDGPSDDAESVKFAKQFEVETVWRDSWMPVLRKRFAA